MHKKLELWKLMEQNRDKIWYPWSKYWYWHWCTDKMSSNDVNPTNFTSHYSECTGKGWPKPIFQVISTQNFGAWAWWQFEFGQRSSNEVHLTRSCFIVRSALRTNKQTGSKLFVLPRKVFIWKTQMGVFEGQLWLPNYWRSGKEFQRFPI